MAVVIDVLLTFAVVGVAVWFTIRYLWRLFFMTKSKPTKCAGCNVSCEMK